MKKLPLVLALSAASICTFANAQISVSVYGRFYPFVLQESVSGATAVGTPVATLAATPSGTISACRVKGMTAGRTPVPAAASPPSAPPTGWKEPS